MQAKKITVKEILSLEHQYIIPLFQRSYSWTKEQWQILWNDLLDLLEIEDTSNHKTHFLGAVMTMGCETPLGSVPKSLVIDGQQRLTTLLVLLVVMRNKAQDLDCQEIAQEIEQKFLTNQFKKGEEKYKLIPTQTDRAAFKKLIDSDHSEITSNLSQCFEFFSRKVKPSIEFQEKLKLTIFERLSLIAVTLDKDDDPYLIFESLNAKGRELTQADLIRNYLFMKIDKSQQDLIYAEKWQPMEDALKENLTEFVRHYLSKNGAQIKRGDIYLSFKDLVNESNALTYLNDLCKFSKYYDKFLEPSHETNEELQKHLQLIKRLDVSVIYPLILNCYDDYTSKHLKVEDFIEALKVLENFIIRRFICNIPTQGLNRIFISLYSQIAKGTSLNSEKGLLDNLKFFLQSQKYPTDAEFHENLCVFQLYSRNSNRKTRAKIILEILENSFGHKEKVSFENLSIEHIMPQTINKEWKNYLGNDWEEIHDLYLHSLGNLTLTAYNSELCNAIFDSKKKELINSNLELNKYFKDIHSWKKDDIEKRTEFLAHRLVNIYPYFGDINNDFSQSKKTPDTITGRKPKSVQILGIDHSVKTWRDVLEFTLNEILSFENDQYLKIKEELSRFIGSEPTKFRGTRQLKNGDYIEVNLSAKDIYTLCLKAVEIAEIQEEWSIHFL